MDCPKFYRISEFLGHQTSADIIACCAVSELVSVLNTDNLLYFLMRSYVHGNITK